MTSISDASPPDIAEMLPVIAMVWPQFGAYHVDRCEALGRAMAGHAQVLGIELSSKSVDYAWERPRISPHFEQLTLYPDQIAVGIRAEFSAVMAILRKRRVRHLFISGYERPASFLIAWAARMLSVRVHIFLDSKFDDKPRRISLEWFKMLLMLPYRTGFAAGPKAADYLRFLGFRRRPIVTGYDVVSLERMREEALPPQAAPVWENRHFLIVARFVEKKNLPFALEAYARFRALGGSDRKLVLCGSGALEPVLRARADLLGIAQYVDFRGFCAQPQVASAMAGALCLMIPSIEEQWGLVVNEAMAFDLPILSSPTVGAAEVLVEPLTNGYVLGLADTGPWAQAMLEMDRDPDLWSRFCAGSRRLAPRGDVGAFTDAVARLTGIAIQA